MFHQIAPWVVGPIVLLAVLASRKGRVRPFWEGLRGAAPALLVLVSCASMTIVAMHGERHKARMSPALLMTSTGRAGEYQRQDGADLLRCFRGEASVRRTARDGAAFWAPGESEVMRDMCLEVALIERGIDDRIAIAHERPVPRDCALTDLGAVRPVRGRALWQSAKLCDAPLKAPAMGPETGISD